MIILNKKTQKILTSHAHLCKDPFSKAIGLMFCFDKEKSLVFIFSKEIQSSLHMWFVFYPIDVLFLDSRKKVVEIKEHFQPFTFYFPQHTSKFIIEVPDGTIQKTGTKITDTLFLKG